MFSAFCTTDRQTDSVERESARERARQREREERQRERESDSRASEKEGERYMMLPREKEGEMI